MKSILIVEDDITYGLILKTWLEKKGFKVDTGSSVIKAQKMIEANKFDLILSDLRLPDKDGITLLEWLKSRSIHIPFIMMTSYADIQSAVHTIKMGASDYIAKPIIPEELLKKMNDAWEVLPSTPTHAEPSSGTPFSRPSSPVSYIEGESEAAKQLYNYVALVAPTNMSVLINGASGTGKEYVAKRIHALSNRREKPFIPIDCGAMPKELAASEFFGHVKGAFTGAVTDKTGAFVEATGGTVFLDEIGNLSYEVQVQLLRALQERKVRPVGSSKEIEVNIRLVSATNENLLKAIEKGAFREDLYHRINEFTLQMPQLKDRREDILLFADFFLNKANKELGKNVIGFDAGATAALLAYHWPGNLRQMNNMVRRAALLTPNDIITCTELAEELNEPHVEASDITLKSEEYEKNQILKALHQTGNNKSKAAKLLNIDRKTLYNKLKLYNIDV